MNFNYSHPTFYSSQQRHDKERGKKHDSTCDSPLLSLFLFQFLFMYFETQHSSLFQTWNSCSTFTLLLDTDKGFLKHPLFHEGSRSRSRMHVIKWVENRTVSVIDTWMWLSLMYDPVTFYSVCHFSGCLLSTFSFSIIVSSQIIVSWPVDCFCFSLCIFLYFLWTTSYDK